MGRGIALSFALAGTKSILIDLKERSAEEFAAMAAAIRAEMETDLGFLAEVGLFDAQHVSRIADRISLVSAAVRTRQFSEYAPDSALPTPHSDTPSATRPDAK